MYILYVPMSAAPRRTKNRIDEPKLSLILMGYFHPPLLFDKPNFGLARHPEQKCIKISSQPDFFKSNHYWVKIGLSGLDFNSDSH